MSDESTNSPSTAPAADETTPITDSSANVPFFKKKTKPSNNKNIRKRKKSPSDSTNVTEEDNSSAVVTKERKLDTSHPFVQASKKGRRVTREEISDMYAANKSAVTSIPEDIATRSAEWDTETDRDAQALLEKKLAAEEALDDNLYKGASSYKSYIKKRDTAAGSAVSSKIKAGPIRAPSNIRVTSRFDYQPDICKDYKETGYCGYGDSCKFLHDRGDYKSGWQLEREWEEMQGKLKKDPNAFLVESSDEESDEELPFACFICRQDFKNPISTKCGHYFCELCALQNYKKSPKCYSCGAPTNGIFNRAKSLLQKIEEKKKRMAEKGETNKEDGNESNKNSDDDVDNDEV